MHCLLRTSLFFRGAAFVASHLTVTTTNAGVSTSRNLNGSGGAGDDSAGTDAFAALLGAGSQSEKTTPAANETPAGGLVDLAFGFGGEGSQQPNDPEAIAAALNVIVPIEAPVETGPALTDLINGLANLQAKLDAGEPIDPDMLQQLNAALTDIADALGLDLDKLPSLDELTALLAKAQPGDTSFAARLTEALGPMAENLLKGTPADANAEMLKSIGDKLAALLVALNEDEMTAEQRASLQLSIDADADLDAAVARLASATAKSEAAAPPALGTPELKITESVLTGKASEAPRAIEPAAAKPDERKPAEVRPPAAAAAAVVEQAEPQAVTQPAQLGRADAVAAPRVVQAGYQTSQQQLNLPQLAFEVVRQASEGNTRFQIRLDPPELGKIDVRLEIDRSGQVNARLTVEKSETLDLMQRDQRGLERALQQAGLDGAKTNLEFSLKQNPFSGGQQGQDGNGRGSLFGGDDTAEADETPVPTVNLYRGSLSASGVNIIA